MCSPDRQKPIGVRTFATVALVVALTALAPAATFAAGVDGAGGGAASNAGAGADAAMRARPLAWPVQGVDPASARDTYAEGRPGHPHEAIDIAAPRGARVYAVDDGTVIKLFSSVPGGKTVYHFDPERRVAYYYAHLDRYAEGLVEGAKLHRCDLIGYVGTTGNAPPNAPHLHFAMFRLGPERHWWQGTAFNPYARLRAAQPCSR
jgi:murein DD-endopeptidase MepM/ murein hydrolase activator NlpD